MSRPAEAVPPLVAAVTMAVIEGARTTRQVARAVDNGCIGCVHSALREARDLGLVNFIDGRAGTLHSPLQIVAASPGSRHLARR